MTRHVSFLSNPVWGRAWCRSYGIDIAGPQSLRELLATALGWSVDIFWSYKYLKPAQNLSARMAQKVFW